jgi:hypothetical protein
MTETLGLLRQASRSIGKPVVVARLGAIEAPSLSGRVGGDENTRQCTRQPGQRSSGFPDCPHVSPLLLTRCLSQLSTRCFLAASSLGRGESTEDLSFLDWEAKLQGQRPHVSTPVSVGATHFGSGGFHHREFALLFFLSFSPHVACNLTEIRPGFRHFSEVLFRMCIVSGLNTFYARLQL